MKNFIKYAVVGIAGYLIGFYEMKYKVLKVFVESDLKKKKEEETKEEAQE